jgi:hypothetical protein
MNWSDFIPNQELGQYYMERNPEMNNIIKIEIQTIIQEYADDNQLFDLKCNHIFEIPSIIRYYSEGNIPEENYRKSYLIMDFYLYDYISKQVYKGKEKKGNVVLKIKEKSEEKKQKSTLFTKLTF